MARACDHVLMFLKKHNRKMTYMATNRANPATLREGISMSLDNLKDKKHQLKQRGVLHPEQLGNGGLTIGSESRIDLNLISSSKT